MTKTMDFCIQRKDRKKLVEVIAEYAQTDPVYCGAPTFAYKIDKMTVDKDGLLTIPDIEKMEAPEVELDGLLEALLSKGFVAALIYDDSEEDEAGDTTVADGPENEPISFRLPADGFTETAKDNLKRLLSAKGELIKKALGVDSLPVEFTDTDVLFPWFSPDSDPADFKAYSHFITALGDMAKHLKRSTAKEKETDNEKYAFRCFLLRLGFIGSEYKTERKILLRNLTGSSAFRTPKEEEQEAQTA